MEGTTCFAWHSEGGAKDEGARPRLVPRRRQHEHLQLSVSGRRLRPVKFNLWLLSAGKNNNNSPGPGSCTRHCSCETRERGRAVFSWTFDEDIIFLQFFFLSLVHTAVANLAPWRLLKTVKMQKYTRRERTGGLGALPMLDQCLQRFLFLFFSFALCILRRQSIALVNGWD